MAEQCLLPKEDKKLMVKGIAEAIGLMEMVYGDFENYKGEDQAQYMIGKRGMERTKVYEALLERVKKCKVY